MSESKARVRVPPPPASPNTSAMSNPPPEIEESPTGFPSSSPSPTINTNNTNNTNGNDINPAPRASVDLSAVPVLDNSAVVAAPVVLSVAQKRIIKQKFLGVVESEADKISPQTVEDLACELFGSSLTDDVLDPILDMTEGKTAISLAEFTHIVASAMAQTTLWGLLRTPITAHVGFDTIGDQIHKKMLKRGFEFNLLLVGQSGLGKSTFVDTLFHGKLNPADCTNQSNAPLPPTTSIRTVHHVIEENNVRLKLAITDTPGFGDQIDNENCWIPVLDFINKQYEAYLDAELAIVRPKHTPDTRVHCCVYFIEPTGHGLKPIDIEFLQQLHTWVNIVPVIAKSDTLTQEEREAFKQRIREDMEVNKIKVYPELREGQDEDPQEASLNEHIKAHIPYAIVGGNTVKQIDGRNVRGRQARYGFVEVDNPNHCEFALLREMLIRTNMQDLKEVTGSLHYENFRRQHLAPSSEA
eukprot:m.116671 g.116671  ORF g.116671 m.116671 type:complete len:469 (-) comp23055_c0_seq3:34-1440(-)